MWSSAGESRIKELRRGRKKKKGGRKQCLQSQGSVFLHGIVRWMSQVCVSAGVWQAQTWSGTETADVWWEPERSAALSVGAAYVKPLLGQDVFAHVGSSISGVRQRLKGKRNRLCWRPSSGKSDNAVHRSPFVVLFLMQNPLQMGSDFLNNSTLPFKSCSRPFSVFC